MYIYIYIHMSLSLSLSTYMCVCIYIYIYIYIYQHAHRAGPPPARAARNDCYMSAMFNACYMFQYLFINMIAAAKNYISITYMIQGVSSSVQGD